MEVLRGPLLLGLGIAAFVHLWNRWRCTGLFPGNRDSWNEMIFRSSASIALTYSVLGAVRHVSAASLIGLAFAIIAIVGSCLSESDGRFLRICGWSAFALGLLLGLLNPVAVE